MKKILLIIAVLLSQYGYGQMIGSHSYRAGDCTILIKTLTASSQTLEVDVNNTGGKKITEVGILVGIHNFMTIPAYDWEVRSSLPFNTGECVKWQDTWAYTDAFKYIRGYFITPFDTIYSTAVLFIVSGSSYYPPYIETADISNIRYNGATSGGKNIIDYGSVVTARGTQYSLTPDFSTITASTNDGTGSVDFTSTVTGLKQNTVYYVRSWATNAYGISYGNRLSFTTPNGGSTIPVVITNPITNITENSATSGGVITYTGGATITSKGLCYKIGNTPISTDNTIYSGSGSESFIANMTGLAQNTEYHVKAWARNSYVIDGFTVSVLGYGQEEIFTTLPTSVTIPVLTTTGVYSVTTTTAYSGGSIVSAGTSPITDWGVCYSTMINPTIENSFVSSGFGQSGSFLTLLSGLNYSTKYYARSYATTVDGTAYGNQIEFTTLNPSGIPTISTVALTNITATSATSGGNSIVDHGASIDHKGIQWSLYSDFSAISGSTDSGTGTTSFVSSITGASCGLVYYVRAYAHNSVGYGYGNTLTLSPTFYPYIFKAWILSITDNSNVVHNGTDLSSAQTICSIQNSEHYKSSIVGAKAFSSYSVGGLMYESVASSWCYSSFTGYLVFYSLSNYSDIVYVLSGAIQSITPCTEITPSVGDSYGGGIVAYIFQSGDPGYVSGQIHGIIAATSDQSTGIQWYNGSYVDITTLSSELHSGSSNTDAILYVQGYNYVDYAAGLARSYTGGVFSDWCLPSLNDLIKLYDNRSIIGGFSSAKYWASGQRFGSALASMVDFSNGDYSQDYNKSFLYHVRAIRYF